MGKFFQRYVRYGKKPKTFKSVESMPTSANKEINDTGMPINNDSDQNIINSEKFESDSSRPTPTPKTVESHIKEIMAKSKQDALKKTQSMLSQSKNTNSNKSETNNKPQAPKKETSSEYKDLPPNLKHSLDVWTKSRRPVVSASQWSKRLSICRGCQFWMENTKTKVAKCMKCGCSSGKLLLATSNCPLNPPKWTSV